MSRTVLVIDSSASHQGSQSRLLTHHFVETWKESHPEDVITLRDIVSLPLPHIDDALMLSRKLPAGEHTAEMRLAAARADELITEYLAADVVVLGVPMYNFSIPSTLKAYIDHIAQEGSTFKYTPSGPVGLSSDKQVYILSTRGGVYDESPMDHQTAYLQTLFGFLGVERIEVIQAQGLNLGEESARNAIVSAKAAIDRAITSPLAEAS